MPIVSRRLEGLQHNRNGTVFAAFSAVDDKGRKYARSRSRFDNPDAAQAAMMAHDWRASISDNDIQDAVARVDSGGSTTLKSREYIRRLDREIMIEARENSRSGARLSRLQAALEAANG